MKLDDKLTGEFVSGIDSDAIVSLPSSGNSSQVKIDLRKEELIR